MFRKDIAPISIGAVVESPEQGEIRVNEAEPDPDYLLDQPWMAHDDGSSATVRVLVEAVEAALAWNAAAGLFRTREIAPESDVYRDDCKGTMQP